MKLNDTALLNFSKELTIKAKEVKSTLNSED